MNSRIVPYRTFKNFGHKRQPVPQMTLLWQGFLTFSFIGLGIEWKTMAKFFFGDGEQISPMDSLEEQKASKQSQ